MQAVNLTKKRKAFIHELSGGQQQRVAIARVLLSNTNIILADEPTGNLDSHNTENIVNILKSLKAQGKTIVLITHDIHVAKQADRIIYIKDGEIVDHAL